ncbi:hypothetical protein BJ138DRAFT_1058157 [Hygrophoropsis aurantiaca]|uniref:Uncharacterized protein n=1 Tax=Hygrophoropsis aurantiaca TaxID=72124 RepID=A0ACB8AKZ7_9AGAM|nr:hypothetical protein BJ138DRAFT_1058157 [Hygrophoropsis aurantiaca]
MDSDDGEIGRGRRHNSSSSRESSPAWKKQKRSFTPTSDDGDIVIPAVPDDDADTPPPEGASVPLIRQAVGFSWTPSTATNIDTYQATLPQKAVARFLPGQAVPVPKKPKVTKPKVPRKKKNEYGDGVTSQTGRFRLSDKVASPSPAPSPAPTLSAGSGPYSSLSSASATVSSGASVAGTASPVLMSQAFTHGSHHSGGYGGNMMPVHDNAAAGPSGYHQPAQSTTIPPAKATKRVKKSSGKHNTPGPSRQQQPSVQPSDPSRLADAQPPPGTQHYRRNYERTNQQIPTNHLHPPAPSSTAPVPSNQIPPPAPVPQPINRPLRMVTLLIEDMRSGVPDSQLAEVRVPLRVLDDPADGFWADAKNICDCLQASPSRIDGPAKVFTLRGKYRQIFMRVSADNVLEVESANLRVTTERTLEIVVEAPVPIGQLPPPPRLPPGMIQTSESESERAQSPQDDDRGSGFGFGGNSPRMNSYPRTSPNKRHRSPGSESTHRASAYGHGSPSLTPKRSRHSRSEHRDGAMQHSHTNGYTQRSSSTISRRSMSPPVMGRFADSQAERDDAVAAFIKQRVENDPAWIQYMQSKAKPQRVSEVLSQYRFVQGKIQELVGDVTPSHWDGAPNSRVRKEHVWLVLKLTSQWGAECQETLELVDFYGPKGTRREDPRVADLINSTEFPKEKAMKHFTKLLRSIHAEWNKNGGNHNSVPRSMVAGASGS